MDNQADNSPPSIDKPAWIRWLIIFGTVWLLLAVTYAILSFQSQRKQRALVQDGVSQAAVLSERAGLPLLEQDIQSLHQILKVVREKPGVLYASVIDHKNKIIAYTDAGRLLPERRENVQQIQGVDTWQDQEALVFSAPVNFADTPIGEIRLALSLKPVLQPKKQFAAIAAVALAGLLFLLFWVYGRTWMARFRRIMHGKRTDIDVRLLLCPLCGQTGAHGSHFRHASNMENAPIIRIFGNQRIGLASFRYRHQPETCQGKRPNDQTVR